VGNSEQFLKNVGIKGIRSIEEGWVGSDRAGHVKVYTVELTDDVLKLLFEHSFLVDEELKLYIWLEEHFAFNYLGNNKIRVRPFMLERFKEILARNLE